MSQAEMDSTRKITPGSVEKSLVVSDHYQIVIAFAVSIITDVMSIVQSSRRRCQLLNASLQQINTFLIIFCPK